MRMCIPSLPIPYHLACVQLWLIMCCCSCTVIQLSVSLPQAHDGPVTGISLHATGDFLLSSSADQVRAYSAVSGSIPHLSLSLSFGLSQTSVQVELSPRAMIQPLQVVSQSANNSYVPYLTSPHSAHPQL